ncbi:MAG: bifunctional diaminohydroxyphosphoribosylaminopyrimidine deaminase/5-amino-6-(5-phosphoribosylamino)uracil reductase RibD [Bacteroidia bacterium]|nr:bifunctional diaminohydroxyphosphoribosylaminopyrimidine deaminase/5-amino-6-(5-phosphoribosylamino)uracil reductase RibD [Bacteroidia bacterium]
MNQELLTPEDEVFLRRCLWLARRACPSEVEPNPLVGAVIAYQGRVLGEGFHRRFGGPHAEIEALHAVKETHLLPQATLYVSLEPCCHSHKKTPPCAPVIVDVGIRRVVIGCVDPNPAVAGEGIAYLRERGVEVRLASEPTPYQRILRHFRVNITEGRPYVTLKWAQTPGPSGRYPFAGGVMGSLRQGQWPLSGFWGKVWGHRLRAAHSHIAVGFRTWHLDQPALTTRYFPGCSPRRIVFYDPHKGSVPGEGPTFYAWEKPLPEMLRDLYEHHQVGSLLVEGGSGYLNRFLAAGVYDEVHVLVSYGATSPPPEEAVWAPAWPPLTWRRIRLSKEEEVWIARRNETLRHSFSFILS